MFRQSAAKIIIVSFLSLTTIFAFQNCGLHLKQQSFGVFQLSQNSQFEGSVCEETLFNEFKKSGGYHDFLRTNCQLCHDGSNINTPRFAHSDPAVAFSKFYEKEILGHGTISDRAVSNHQSGYTGPQHATLINKLKTDLSIKIQEYQVCQGGKSQQTAYKTQSQQFKELASSEFDTSRQFRFPIIEDELELSIEVSRKKDEEFLVIKNPKFRKLKNDNKAYQVLGMDILINGVVSRDMTLFRIINSQICTEDFVKSLSSNSQELYVPVNGSMSVNDTIQFQINEVRINDKVNVTCTQPELWSLYAGSTDRGDGFDLRKALFTGDGYFSYFTIDQTTGDIYIVDLEKGLRKYSYTTKQVSTVIEKVSDMKNSNLNMDSGSLGSRPTFVFGNFTNIISDSKGRIYLALRQVGYNVILYQFDFKNRTYRKYVGGGELSSANQSASNIQLLSGYSFDDNDNLYFWSSCPTTNSEGKVVTLPSGDGDSQSRKKIILKISQDDDGNPGKTEAVFGSCTSTLNLTSGAAAISQPGVVFNYPFYSPIVALSTGQVFFSINGGSSYKINNTGTFLKSNIGGSDGGTGMSINIFNRDIYRISGNILSKVNINWNSDNGDSLLYLLQSDLKYNNCENDFSTSKDNYCAKIAMMPVVYNSQIYFSEGAAPNNPSNFRIMKIQESVVNLVVGRKSFVAADGQRLNVEGQFAGIYYKKSTESNSELFPEGLYFFDRNGLVFGKIDDQTNLVRILAGNQSKINKSLSKTEIISDQLSLGTPYGGGNGHALTFDKNGLPWFRANSNLYSIGSDGKLIAKTNSSTSIYIPQITTATMSNPLDTTNPSLYGFHPYGGYTNLTLKDNGAFVLPNYRSGTSFNPYIQMRYLNFTSNTSPVIIGGDFKYVEGTPNISSDITTAGQVKTAPLYTNCYNTEKNCYLLYEPLSDRLYFSEGKKLRYIVNPDVTANSTLHTLFSMDKDIRNFVINPSRNQLWYFKDNGLYCYDMGSGAAICDNTTNYFAEVIQAGYPFQNGANQITFKDDDTIFVSNYFGQIFKMNIPDSRPSDPNNLPLPDRITFNDLVGGNVNLNVFARRCLSCHTGTNARGGLNLENAAQAVAAARSRVATDSISTRIQSSTSPMPPTSQGQLSERDKNLILKWIQDDAPVE